MDLTPYRGVPGSSNNAAFVERGAAAAKVCVCVCVYGGGGTYVQRNVLFRRGSWSMRGNEVNAWERKSITIVERGAETGGVKRAFSKGP